MACNTGVFLLMRLLKSKKKLEALKAKLITTEEHTENGGVRGEADQTANNKGMSLMLF